MKPQQFILFVKYPYAVAVIGSIWVGSAVMAFINQDLPIITMIIVNVITTWLIAWLSFRYGDSK